jgi:hypothetical protein
MKRVYICAPYSGDRKANREKAKGYALLAKDQVHAVFCPHLYYETFMDEDSEREAVIQMCLEEVERSDELWVCGYVLSAGMTAEILTAQRNDVTIVFV